MDNWMVFTRRRPSTFELRDFGDRHDGYWNETADLDEGVIEQGTGTLYITNYPDFSDEVSPREMSLLTEILGGVPRGALSVDIGGDDRPVALANTVTQSMARQWRGYIYKQEGEIGAAHP